MTFKVFGSVPSKKNNRRPLTINGRKMNLPSHRYETWHKGAQNQLIEHWNTKIEHCRQVRITIFPPNQRRFDLSNKAESLMDLLVDCGILVDDNYQVVPELVVRYGGVSKDAPRAEIVIET